MASSITHRATGIALYAGTVLLAVWFFAAALGEAALTPIHGLLGSPIGLITLFGFAWSLFFHSMNGLRHLYWDSGRGLDPKTARMTAWFIFAASIAATIALFILAGAV